MSQSFDSLEGRALLVIGGTGFLGSAVVRAAVEAGVEVTVLGRASSDRWRLREVEGRYRYVETSLTQIESIDPKVPQGTVVVNAAAAGVNQRETDSAALIATNVVGTADAVRWAHHWGCSRFVLLGSSGEYGTGVRHQEGNPLHPTSEYGATRASATLIARAYGAAHDFDVVVMRPFAVFGPYEAPHRLIPHVITHALRGEPIRISSGEQTRDYVYLEDVVDGIARGCTYEAARHGIFNLCSGVETSVRNAAEIAAALVDPGSNLVVGGMGGIPGEMGRTTGDSAMAREQLGWEPQYDLRTGLEATVSWFRDGGIGYYHKTSNG